MSAGVYQLSFKVVMTGSNVRIVDNTKYVYGCTIDGNDTLQRNVGYLWKSVTPKVEEDVKLTFVVTDAEAQAGTVQTWLWNFANIGDGSTFRLHLKDIKIEYDKLGETKDKYERELVWVYVDNELLENGRVTYEVWINALTPLEALNKLNDIKRIVKGR